MSFRITGTGSAFPEQIIDNRRLAELLDTSDEWIRSRTGITERRILKDETLLSLAVKAAEAALENSGTAASELDLLIVATIHGTFITPAMSCLTAKAIGAANCRVHDINMACSGFIYALDIADSYFRAGKANKALIIGCEAASALADWTDRSTCVLFGDAAGAAVLEKGAGMLGMSLTSDGAYEILYADRVKGNCPFTEFRGENSFYKMQGQEVYMFAVNATINEINNLLERINIPADGIDFYLMHQANLRIIDSTRKKLKQPAEKFPLNIEKYGNTSSATLPTLLDGLNRSGRLKNGQKLVMCSFGAGLSSAACAFEWKK